MSLPPLSVEEFEVYFSELHGKRHGPFPWQTRLAKRIASEGRWPTRLDLPTASGKTAALDIALFHLALEVNKGPERRAPVRIAFVVDRKVIVDAAYDRARHISNTLANALKSEDTGHVLTRVARRLCYLSGSETPVIARALHSGTPRENDWARTPAQPTILCSTVDQVGSRLLFRGYGISDSMKPVHAGLMGSDCLILLDEAHLSEPFRQTLELIERYRRPPWTEREPAPWGHVVLTATPAQHEPTDFGLEEDDYSHPELSRRLSAAKPTKLVLAKCRTTDLEAHATELVDCAWKRSGIDSPDAPPRVVAIVVNRVALARRCHGMLSKRIQAEGRNAEAILLVGRTREVERKQLLDRYKGELLSGRSDPSRTLFVVATQCIEAGADFDFDVVVTQLAPLDALRQRFGRLNRMGRNPSAEGVIVACPDEVGQRANDPLYGTRAKATWEALQASSDAIDFGILAMKSWLAEQKVAELISEPRDAPVLLPAHVDLLAETTDASIDDPAPDPALFLHGTPDALPDVQIVWRADLRESDLSPEGVDRAREILALMPPRAAEAIAVPIRAAREWLADASVDDISDVESGTTGNGTQPPVGIRRALRWLGADSDGTGSVWSPDLRPGDLIVVPASYGGCDEFGWRPGLHAPVRDLADEAARPYSPRRFALRVHRAVLQNMLGETPEVDRIWAQVHAAVQEARAEPNGAVVAAALAQIDGLPSFWSEALKALARQKGVLVAFPYDDENAPTVSGLVLVSRTGVDLGEQDARALDEPVTEGDDAGSFRARAIPLAEHAAHVEKKARAFAAAAGLPERTAADVAIAAFLHDEGKADPRFQAYLRGGDRLLARLDSTVLAKSDKRMTSRRSDQRARRLAELPDRWRHEADSVWRALSHSKLGDVTDRELVLWLVGTHHGYGRPRFPHADPVHAGPQDPDFRIDGWDWSQIFTRLMRRYGAWELARLEAIVRLADHRASEEEEEEEQQ